MKPSSQEIKNKVTGLPQLSAREVDLRVKNDVAFDYTAYYTGSSVQTRRQRSMRWPTVGWTFPSKGRGVCEPPKSTIHPTLQQDGVFQVLLLDRGDGGKMCVTDATPDQTARPAKIRAGQPWTASQEDFTVAGLYSPKKLKEWRSKILFPHTGFSCMVTQMASERRKVRRAFLCRYNLK